VQTTAPVTRLTRPLALALLAGTALLGIGAVMHPILPGDAASQLRLIAETSYWRPIHLLMLVGSALVIVGLWVRTQLGTTGSVTPLLAALAVIALGIALNALNIAYMASAGWQMADRFAAGRSEMSAIFEATHPIGLMAARFGNLIVALGALLLAWHEWNDVSSKRWIAVLALVAGVSGLMAVAMFDESSKLVLAAVATLSGWQVAIAWRALRARPAS
jgi:hypothetical protein